MISVLRDLVLVARGQGRITNSERNKLLSSLDKISQLESEVSGGIIEVKKRPTKKKTKKKVVRRKKKRVVKKKVVKKKRIAKKRITTFTYRKQIFSTSKLVKSGLPKSILNRTLSSETLHVVTKDRKVYALWTTKKPPYTVTGVQFIRPMK